MEKTKRLSLGVRKRNKKSLLKKVVDYLKSDFYMFAPLVKSRSHRKIHFSSAVGIKSFFNLLVFHHFFFVFGCVFYSFLFSGMEIKEPVKGKNKKLLEKIVDYMKSDSYLYASLIAPQPMASSRKGTAY